MAFHVARVKVNETNKGTYTHMKQKLLVPGVGVDKSQVTLKSCTNEDELRKSGLSIDWRIEGYGIQGFRDYWPLAWCVGCLKVRCCKIARRKYNNYALRVLSTLVKNSLISFLHVFKVSFGNHCLILLVISLEKLSF